MFSGHRAVARSMMLALGNRRYCNAFYTISDGAPDPEIQAFIESRGVTYQPQAPVFDALLANGTAAFEFPTLFSLWTWCKVHPEHSVAYLHSLGSHKSWSLRRQLTRLSLQGQVLTAGKDECEGRLRGKWHCGPNIAASGCWPHYRGNFWRASCEHVNTLEDPTPPKIELERAMAKGAPHGNDTVCPPHGPTGRYWAEAWIVHGHADVADKLQLVEIQGMGDAHWFCRLVHRVFMKNHWNLLFLIDKVSYLMGTTWGPIRM